MIPPRTRGNAPASTWASPIASITNGGVNPTPLTWTTGPLQRIAESATSRCPPSAIASAPAAHSSLTTNSRSWSWTVYGF